MRARREARASVCLRPTGDRPLHVGQVFHQTALYELLYLLAIYVGLRLVLARHAARPGNAIAVFCVAYGVCRFLSDSLRVNDERLLGLTGAQFLSVALIAAGGWLLWRVVPNATATPVQEVAA